MLSKTVASLILVALVALAVEAQRKPGGRFPKPSFLDFYSWQYDFGDGTVVEQKAFVNTAINVTLIISLDSTLKDTNISGSMSFYHDSGVVAVKMVGRSKGRGGRGRFTPPCFLTSSTTPYADMVADVIAKNGTEVALPAEQVNLNGTGKPMNWFESFRMYRSVRPLMGFCFGSKLVETTAASVDSDDPDSVAKHTLGLEGQVNVYVPNLSNKPKPGPRPFPFPRPRPRPRSRSRADSADADDFGFGFNINDLI